MFRTLALVLAVLALCCFAAAPALAKAEEKDNIHEGTFVKAEDNKLTMKDKENKEFVHDMVPNTKVTCDGKDCKASDLKPGTKIKATLNNDKKVTKIEGFTK
jgi:hypothetical protein